MDTWSKRRKTIIATIVTIFVICVIGIPAFLLFYRAPTCFDGIQNGSEQGIDCGGKCTRLCQSAFLAPSVAWTRFEGIAPGLYNTAAYIVNPNTEAEARNVPYHMDLYDNKGQLILSEKGSVTLPPHRNTLAFKSAVDVGKSIPAKMLFEFTAMPNWVKKIDPLQTIRVKDKNFTDEANNSSLSVTLGNEYVLPLENVSVYAILYDKLGNAIGFSKTVVDQIPANGDIVAPFTWPVGRQGKVISIEVLPVAE